MTDAALIKQLETVAATFAVWVVINVCLCLRWARQTAKDNA